MIEKFWASGEGGSWGKETSNIREKGNGENGGKAIGGMGERNERKQKKRVESSVNFVW